MNDSVQSRNTAAPSATGGSKPVRPPQKKSAGTEPEKNQNPDKPPEKKFFNDTHKYLYEKKESINKYVHMASATVNALTFLNGNFNFFDLGDELQEGISNVVSRCATGTRGLTGILDCHMKQNLIPLLGSAMEVPVAVFAKGDDLWLMRGIAQSIRQFQGVIKRSGMKHPNSGEILSTKDGDDFPKYGITMFKGFTASLKEAGKIAGEFFTSPFKEEKRFSRSVLFCSLFQGGGPIMHLFGFEKLGPFFRDFAGALIDVAYITDKKEPGKHSYVPAGTLWIGSAICDYAKRFEGVTDSVKNMTQLSLFFDMLAATFESRANFDTGNNSSTTPTK